jgi:hypothetical protein
MLVCVYSVFVFFCVQVAALRQADPPSEESDQMSIRLRNSVSEGATGNMNDCKQRVKVDCQRKQNIYMTIHFGFL